jgi:hypothetical protein
MTYLCSVNLRDENLRAHEKNFTGPRGRPKIARKEDILLNYKIKDYGTESKG